MKQIFLVIALLISENIVLTNFLGLSLFIDEYKRKEKVILNGVFITIIGLLSIASSFILNKYLLIPNNILYLNFITNVLIVIIFTKIIGLLLKKIFINSYDVFKKYYPLILINCITFSLVLLNINIDENMFSLITNSFISFIGFILILYIFEGNKEKIRNNKIIRSFKIVPINLIILGLIALIFSRI